MNIIRWEDPPPPLADRRQRPRRTDYWRYVADKLREHPGRWAVVLEDEAFGYAAGMATQIKAGRLAAFRPSGSFEAQTRTVDSKYACYARYVGEAEDD
jgi:hypothetical protein